MRSRFAFSHALATGVLLQATVASAVTSTVGVYDSVNNLNAVDSSASTDAGNQVSLATFTANVQAAFNNDLGGVINFDNGSITTTQIEATYGQSQSKSITINNGTAGENWSINSVLADRTPISGSAFLVKGTSPDFTFNFALADRVLQAGATILGRSGTSSSDFNVTATYTDPNGNTSTSSVLFNSNGSSGNAVDDTFAGLKAPAGSYITKLNFDGSSFRGLDDLGFITAQTAELTAGTTFKADFGPSGSPLQADYVRYTGGGDNVSAAAQTYMDALGVGLDVTIDVNNDRRARTRNALTAGVHLSESNLLFDFIGTAEPNSTEPNLTMSLDLPTGLYEITTYHHNSSGTADNSAIDVGVLVDGIFVGTVASSFGTSPTDIGTFTTTFSALDGVPVVFTFQTTGSGVNHWPINGFDLVVLSAAVPEPATLSLGVLGLAMLARRRRRAA